MGFCTGDCGNGYTCTGWDGTGAGVITPGASPNHNLVEACPTQIEDCEYRKQKMKSDNFVIRNLNKEEL